MYVACWDYVSRVLLKVYKASIKALAHLKEQLEHSLRPTGNQNDPWAILDKTKKNLKSFRLQIKIL